MVIKEVSNMMHLTSKFHDLFSDVLVVSYVLSCARYLL